jgi:hypothetical protein
MSGRNEMQREYYKDIKDLAQSVYDEYQAGDIADRDSLIEHIHETVDGCARVIYTTSAQEALVVSRNDSAGIDNLGADGFDWSSGIPWSALAYFTVEADVFEELDRMGLDVNADFDVCDKHKKPHVDECEECETEEAQAEECA